MWARRGTGAAVAFSVALPVARVAWARARGDPVRPGRSGSVVLAEQLGTERRHARRVSRDGDQGAQVLGRHGLAMRVLLRGLPCLAQPERRGAAGVGRPDEAGVPWARPA